MSEQTYNPGDKLPDGNICLGFMNGNYVSVPTVSPFPGKYTWDDAMKLQKDGWFIPDRYECLMIYDYHRDNPGAIKFEENNFWSASCCGDSHAYSQWVDDGNQRYYINGSELPVFPVRRFPCLFSVGGRRQSDRRPNGY